MRIATGLAALLLVTGASCLAGDDSGRRNWTSAQGQSIQASFAGLEGTAVRLRKDDGAVVSIPLDKLSAEDQKIAQDLAAAGTSPSKKLSSAGLGGAGGEALTDNELETLKAEWTDEKSGKRLVFQAGCGVRKVDAQEKKKYAKSGKVPIRVTADFLEIKTDKGKQIAARVSGTGHVYILDSSGKAVLAKSVSLDKLCPS